MQRKNNIVLRLHRQRKAEQVLLPLVREDNGEALRVILEKQDNVTAEFIYRTEKKVRSGWLKLEIEQDGCRRSDNLEEELPVILEVETADSHRKPDGLPTEAANTISTKMERWQPIAGRAVII